MPSLSNLASSLSTSGWILQAHDGIRTRDLFLTKEVLYRLSYMGPFFVPTPTREASLSRGRGAMLLLDGAGNGIRTRDPELGRLALYQLSYSRPLEANVSAISGGEGRIRTSEGISRQIYSLLPLATREPLRSKETLESRTSGRPADRTSQALPV
jgi:hypothetical protein